MLSELTVNDCSLLLSEHTELVCTVIRTHGECTLMLSELTLNECALMLLELTLNEYAQLSELTAY